MKRCIRTLIALALLSTVTVGHLAAKKVKFMVDMTGIVKNAFGIHVAGDFQTLAGYAGGDFNSATTEMFQEPGDTNLYGLVVDLPPMAKYEFKFVNGIQFYEVEFVPVESRVGYQFNDNRWFYLDSLSPDTTVLPALRFSGNAPMGMRLMRFLVNMQNEPSVSPLGVHIEGDYNAFATPERMYSFATGIWEDINHVDTTVAMANYRYMNGNLPADVENLGGASCAAGGLRMLMVPKDTVLPVVCFGSCTDCIAAGTAVAWVPRLEVYPNPAAEAATVRLSNHFGDWTLRLQDQQGRVVWSRAGSGEQLLRIERGHLPAGLYFVEVRDVNGDHATQKLIFQ